MQWYRRYGWVYNPFAHLDAAKDPHLLEYLYLPPALYGVKDETSLLVFAPAGGGKTALRIGLEREALMEQGVTIVLPVVPERPWETLDHFYEDALRVLARRLWLQALWGGEATWRALTATDLAFLGGLWNAYLPFRPLLEAWVRNRQWETLERHLQLLLPPLLPEQEQLEEFLVLYQKALAQAARRIQATPHLLWDGLALLRARMGAQRFFVYVDGLDAFPETRTPQTALAQLRPVLEHLGEWEARGVYLKAFLPGPVPEGAHLPLDFVELAWGEEDLIRILQLRVRAASRGVMTSLDAVAVPGFREVERHLVQRLPQERAWPRELIYLTRRLLEHAQGRRLRPEDLERVFVDIISVILA